MQMQMILIDKDIPVPSIARSRKSKLPVAEMAVGDSFFLPGYRTKGDEAGKKAGRKTWNTPSNAPPGTRFSTRSWVHNNVPGIRVWRVE